MFLGVVTFPGLVLSRGLVIFLGLVMSHVLVMFLGVVMFLGLANDVDFLIFLEAGDWGTMFQVPWFRPLFP